MTVCDNVEEILFKYVTETLTLGEITKIHCGGDILNSLSMDAEEEIKERVWELIKEEMNYRRIVDEIHDWLKKNSICDDADDEEEEECNCNHQSDTTDDDSD